MGPDAQPVLLAIIRQLLEIALHNVEINEESRGF
jgi:hypothetical protein